MERRHPAQIVADHAETRTTERDRSEKAPSGLEPLFSENADPERQALEHPAVSGSELNPFLARVLERVKQNEAERAR